MRILKPLLIILVLLGLGLLGARLVANKKAALAAVPPAKEYALVVPSEVARREDATLTLPYLSEVQSDSDTRIASKATARVLMIKPAGTRVKQGELVARLDASDLTAKREGLRLKIRELNNQIRAKTADLNALRKTHERNAQLLSINAISRDKYDTEAARIDALRATIDALRSSIAALRQNIREVEDALTYTEIHAPMDGVISDTSVSEGGTATAGQALLTISGGTQRRLVVRVPHELHPRQLIWNGQTCDLAALGSTYHGLDEYSCAVKTDIPGGNRVEVSLVVFSGEALLLPHNAVLSINGRHEVLILEGEHARGKRVDIEAEGVEGYAVEGLEEGVRYLTAKPDILLQAKAGVKIVSPSQSAKE